MTEVGHTRALRQEMIESYTSRFELGQLLSDVNEAETSQRGYLLSGDESFLAGYRRDRAEIPMQLAALEKRCAAFPVERARLDGVARLIRLEFGEMDQAITLHREGRPREAMAVFADGRGRREMDGDPRVGRSDPRRRQPSDRGRPQSGSRPRHAHRTDHRGPAGLPCHRGGGVDLSDPPLRRGPVQSRPGQPGGSGPGARRLRGGDGRHPYPRPAGAGGARQPRRGAHVRPRERRTRGASRSRPLRRGRSGRAGGDRTRGE